MYHLDNLKDSRKATGECVQCGLKMDRVGVCCKRCTKMNTKSKGVIVQKLHEEYYCSNCRKPMDRIGWMCKECLGKLRAMGERRTTYRRSQGLCVQCGLKAEDGRSQCRKCLDKLKVRRGYKKI